MKKTHVYMWAQLVILCVHVFLQIKVVAMCVFKVFTSCLGLQKTSGKMILITFHFFIVLVFI
jgi:hypothetical protein